MRAAYCNIIYCLARERLQYIDNIRFPIPATTTALLPTTTTTTTTTVLPYHYYYSTLYNNILCLLHTDTAKQVRK